VKCRKGYLKKDVREGTQEEGVNGPSAKPSKDKRNGKKKDGKLDKVFKEVFVPEKRNAQRVEKDLKAGRKLLRDAREPKS